MCEKLVDYCHASLKFVPAWFVTSKMIKIVFTAFYAYENILCFNEDSGNVVFNCSRIGIVNIILTILTLTILILRKVILILLFLSGFWHGILKLKNGKPLKR